MSKKLLLVLLVSGLGGCCRRPRPHRPAPHVYFYRYQAPHVARDYNLDYRSGQ